MTHVRIDNERLNSKRRFACGIGPDLPPGDRYVFAGELCHMVDCPGCGGAERRPGTPVSELSGRPGRPGFEKFCEIARSWGYD